jgi:hypothetical protein
MRPENEFGFISFVSVFEILTTVCGKNPGRNALILGKLH